MNKKNIDHWPTAYGYGIAIWFAIAWFICKYFPEDATWWQDALLWVWIVIVILLVPTIWLPSPEKTEKEEGKKREL